MPKLEYPAYFENGLVGVKCKEDIQHREAFLFVPNKMLFSVEKVSEHEILGPIVEAHPDLFDIDEEDDANSMVLTLGLIYEITLGKKSYWYPYLRMMPDVAFTSSWRQDEIEMCQDE